MIVGNIVTYRERTGRYLRSGGSAYPFAIVASLTPLTLISEEGDMKWTATVEPKYLEVIGTATQEQMAVVMAVSLKTQDDSLGSTLLRLQSKYVKQNRLSPLFWLH